MRLKAIRLAGFKSFVDPTTVPFTTNMTGIVGPNGCGKSNTIDAVRWVMGESSAKYLRGDAMTDVIFNGSAERKPVSKASVDLVFDNSDRTLRGEFAGYNEINVRRQVTRDGQSTYYLNGTKCRRKDVTDLFLGTGLGPRSYAIIEQGMISRLIEAKPEELRVYVEEAAGISKYKERRRETENRIRRTHENLERLADIREELDRQLAHLQRQAQAAEKYKALKTEERQKKSELQAIRWQTLSADYDIRQHELQRFNVTLSQHEATQQAADTGIESLKQNHFERSEEFNQAQANYYNVGAKIARYEQKIEHQSQLTLQLDKDLTEVQSSLAEVEASLEQDQLELETLAEQKMMLEPEWEMAEAAIEEAQIQIEQAEEAQQLWQAEWDEFTQRSSEPTRIADVAQSKIQSSEQQVQRLLQQQQKQQSELQLLDQDPDAEIIAQLSEETDLLNEALEEQQLRLEEAQERVTESRQSYENKRQRLELNRGKLQQQQSRQSTLEALQAASRSGDSEKTKLWLETCQLARRPRLIERIQVSQGWDLAVETVLGQRLQAIIADDFAQTATLLEKIPEGVVSLWSAIEQVREPDPTNSRVTLEPLAQYVTQQAGLQSALGAVFVAENLAQALSHRHQLEAQESIVTRDGIWLGPQWIIASAAVSNDGSVLARQQELEQLVLEVDELELTVEEDEIDLDTEQLKLRQLEQQREQDQREWQAAQQKLAGVQSQLAGKQAKAEQLNMRRQRLLQDQNEVDELLSLEREQVADLRLQWQEAMAAISDDSERRDQLQERKLVVQSDVSLARDRVTQQRDQTYQLQLQRQQLATKETALTAALSRLADQLQTLQGRRSSLLENQQRDTSEDLAELKLELETCLEQRITAEQQMSAARQALEQVDAELRQFEQQRHDAMQAIIEVRNDIERVRMESQALDIRRQALVEQLEEEKLSLQQVLESLNDEADAEIWQQELEKIAERIQRLGAINLAAIDEYQLQSERKVYLDAQNQDLEAALAMLEGAIHKIDKETRHRFQETFDQMNAGLADLFPKVFGGGHASLELTGDDLLTTGVAIMARPPGKKNSTIHLLSGGEKALTAIALVFSIFQLNPAPFCMLDEVDAPLDDANVGRYARLVKAMSDTVQFIYITHNKIAMEKADQLMGVTMHEPGVSRLVSVDVEAAAEMIEA